MTQLLASNDFMKEKDMLERKKEIQDNLTRVHQTISRCKHSDQQVKLVCVSKNHPLSDILLANELGERDFGENRVQELVAKQASFASLPATERQKYDFNWHMIGRLQTNKVKDIVGLVKLIHSVDSLRLLARIDKISGERKLVSQVLLQVNVSQEKSKQGFAVQDLSRVISTALTFKHIKLRGLMTMAPLVSHEDRDVAREVFQKTRELLLQFQSQVGSDFDQLSMGMTSDYDLAVEEGASLVRIGTDIFGQRKD